MGDTIVTEVTSRPKVGVGVLVIQNGQLLLGERVNAHGSGTWSSPGGHLEYGESPIQCAIRELKEETGLVARDVVSGPWTNDFFEAEGKHYITLFMVVKRFEGMPTVMEPDKSLSWKWFDCDDLPQPLFLPDRNLHKTGFLETLFLRDFSKGVKPDPFL